MKKYTMSIAALMAFSCMSFGVDIQITEPNITDSKDFGDSMVQFKPSSESGDISYTFGEGVSVTANQITFSNFKYKTGEDEEGNPVYSTNSITGINFLEGSSIKATGSEYGVIQFSSGVGPITSSKATFESPYAIRVWSDWTSKNDTINTAQLRLNGPSSSTFSNLTYNSTGGEDSYFETSNSAKASFTDSNLNFTGTLSIGGSSNVEIVNSKTTYESNEMSKVSGGTLTIKGGTFTVTQGNSRPESFVVENGSLIFDGATVDMTGVTLGTRGSDYRNAVITIKNGTNFKAAAIDLYTYDSRNYTTEFNIESGSIATIESLDPYNSGNRGGIINVNNATLNLGSGLVQAANNGKMVHTTKLNVSNGAKASINGDLDVSAVTVSSASLDAASIVVGADRTFAAIGEADITADLLKVYEGASVSLDDSTSLTLGELEVVITSGELNDGSQFNLSDIFGDDTSIVLSSVEDNITMSDLSGNSFIGIVSGNGMIIASSAVPEPSEIAAIIGIIALTFAAYRRKKNA